MKSYLASVVSLGVMIGCALSGERARPVERPLSSGEMAMGYQDAVDLGSAHVASRGYSDAELQGAEQLWPNIWRVRFGLAPKGSGRGLHLYFDGAKRTLVREEVHPVIGGSDAGG